MSRTCSDRPLLAVCSREMDLLVAAHLPRRTSNGLTQTAWVECVAKIAPPAPRAFPSWLRRILTCRCQIV
jgi:hypothetical protein